ncbi:MAG: hypothetical protein INR71_12015 [Terriglobus roseus]|nr:hypothetical protein [Terriglobus roseus]
MPTRPPHVSTPLTNRAKRTGLPNDHYFPYDTLEAKTSLPDRWHPTPNDPVDPPSARLAATSLSGQQQQQQQQQAASASTKKKERGQPGRPETSEESQIVVPHTSSAASPLRKIDLDSALQYGTAQGYPPLYAFVREFTRQHLHPTVPYARGPEVILTCGSTDALSKVVPMLCNEWFAEHDPVEERDGVLCEEYAYMNAIQTCRARGLNIAPVGIDDEGMRADGPGGLEDVLENWDYSKGKRPHMMYTVT